MRTFFHFALLIFILLTFALPDTMAQVSTDRFAKTPMQIPPRLRPAAKVTFSGHLHDKMTLVLQNSLRAQDMEHIVEPFHHRNEDRWWQSEFWGKWMLSAAKAYEYSGDEDLFAMMKASTREMIATQTPDGHIGNYAPEYHLKAWDVGPGETASLPAKWMSPDGRKCHLVFSGDDYFSVREVRFDR